MFSGHTIRQLQNDAAQKAAEQGKQPLVIWDQDSIEDDIRHIPNLGTHEPSGWELLDLTDEGWNDELRLSKCRYYALFVDKQGLGEAGEAALTFDELIPTVGYLIQIADDQGIKLGFAIVEEGQFQIHVGVFKKLASCGVAN